MTEPFMLRAMLAGLALALVAAPLGCFVVWRRMAYFGETIAQGGLLGVALGVVLSINTTLGVLGVAMLLSLMLVRLGRQTLVPLDSVLGVLAHATLAVGIVVASLVRGPAVDLMAILFGDIYAVTQFDLQWMAFAGVITFIALVRIWNPLLSLSVHEDLAGAEGVPLEWTKGVFILLLALVVAISIKIVGALLTIAFLIMPASAARPFSETPEQMAFFATIFATLAVAFGLFLSVSLDAPGGPSIVLVLTAMFALAMVPVAISRRAG